MPKLQIHRDGVLVRTVDLGSRDLRIGKAPGNDVVLEESGTDVDRHHAELRQDAGRYQLIDLSNEKGILVGGQRVPRAVLAPGVRVEIGPYAVSMVADSVEAKAPPIGDLETAVLRAPTVPAPIIPPLATSVAEEPAGALSIRPTAPPSLVAPKTTTPSAEGVQIGLAPPVVPIATTPPTKPVGGATVLRARTPRKFGVLIPVIAGAAVAAAVMLVVALLRYGPTYRDVRAPAGSETVHAAAPGDAAADEFVTQRLGEARAAMARGEHEAAIRDQLDPVLGKYPDYAPAVALRAEAEEALRVKQTAAQAAVVATNTPPPATGEGAAKTAGPPRPRKPAEDRETRARNQDLARRYNAAEEAFKAGNYRFAISNLNSVLRTDPNFPNAESLLNQVQGAARGKAEEAFAAGRSAEESKDYAGAIKAYHRSQELAAEMYNDMPGVDEAVNRVRERMSAEGSDAYRRARQMDAFGRTTDAIAAYARAVELLPDSDPNRRLAEERLAALRRP